jgi:hypothetical protein
MKRMSMYWLRSVFIPCVLSIFTLASRAEINPKYYAVEVSASVQAAPPQINLKWAPDGNSTGYTIYRKAPNASSWSQITTLAGNATTWADLNVANGGSYEYAVMKNTSAGYQGTGYMLAGINAPMMENRGKLVLIVDNTHAAALSTELARLQQDLVGDGWTVVRRDVSRSDSPVTVKNLIKAEYNADPSNVKSVFLFGHVAVPYSGNFNPDGHPDHKGAWAADTYYGDMDGSWTDLSVNNSAAEKPWNRNVPGDGKFDQSDLPSDLELAVGRVDLYNLTCYANKAWSRSELDLLRAYLNKHHNFRHGQIALSRRGLVCDNFGEAQGEAFASTGWRSFAPFFGAENNVQVPYGAYFSTLKDNAYLWSYGTGGGSWYTCNGVGSSDDFALNEIKTVFTSFLGSYFGDWDNESNFMRASLGSGYVLATAWGGRPHWFFHRMGLGETIGDSAQLSQNNRNGGVYGQQNWGTRQVHISLLGDPTLRMHPVIPPSNLSAGAGSGVTLNWNASTDANIQGYAVYRASSMNGPFSKISGSAPLVTLGFSDVSGTAGSVYMVRAIKLEQSGSGSYYNLSQGVFATAAAVATPTPTPVIPDVPTALSGTVLSSSSIKLQWNDNSGSESGFKIVRKAGSNGASTTISVGANVTSFTDFGLSAGTQYFYKVYAWNLAGDSPYSNEIALSTPAAAAPTPVPTTAVATFVKQDTTTAGSWKGVYGAEGVVMANDQSTLPAFATGTIPAAGSAWTWLASTSDPRALQKAAAADRIASCWYSGSELDLRLNLTDGQTHRVAIYCVDFDSGGRQQTVELYDVASGTVLQTRSISSFTGGVWLVFDVKGNIGIRARNSAGNNAVISGLFFGSAPSSTPVQDPTPAPSTGNAVRFVGVNTTTQGNWAGVFGSRGYQMMGFGGNLPAYATVKPSGHSEWIWSWSSTATPALRKPRLTDRIAACWYSATSFDVNVNIADGQASKVSFYCLDWDAQNRTQRIDVLDATTGAILHTTNVSSFQTGSYLSFDTKGKLIFRFTRTGPGNSVISGIFFDAASAAL